MKRLIPALLAAVMTFSAAAPVYADTTTTTSNTTTASSNTAKTTSNTKTVTDCFTDVADNAFYLIPVYWAKLNDITSGTSDTTYSPGKPCTRGQMAAFLWRMKGSPEPARTDYFEDVPSGSDFAKAIAWARESGITSGTSDTTYSPDQPCTRGQMALFLWRLNGSPEPEGTGYFTDVSTDSGFADAVAWAKENDITSGTAATTYSPGQPCTRGEMATFLWRQSDSPTITWVVDKPAWDETLVDKEAYDEQVYVPVAYDEPVYETVTEYHCWGCGKVFYDADELDAHKEAAWAAAYTPGMDIRDIKDPCAVEAFWSIDKQIQTGTKHHDVGYETVHHDAATHKEHHKEIGHWEQAD